MLLSKNPEGPVILISRRIDYTFPFSFAYLVAYLQKHHEDVRMLFRPEHARDYPAFVREIIQMKPVLVGSGNIYPDLYHSRDLFSLFESEGREFPLIVGGQMVTPTPEFSVEITGADYGVVGEGEIILLKLVRALREAIVPWDLPGLVIRDENGITNNGPGEFLRSMADLPAIPYELFPEDRWLNIGKFYTHYGDYFLSPMYKYTDRIVPVHGGRGCAYRCNFCYHHSIPRYRPLGEMINEAEYLLKRFDANMIEFNDDLVIASPNRARGLVEGMEDLNQRMGKVIEYSISSRFNILARMDDDILQGLKRTGCRIMGIGLESGSQRILDIMHKRITVQQIEDGIRRLRDVSIFPIVAFMVGQLDETVEDVEMSIELMRKLVRINPFFVTQFTITTPYPGSELYDKCFEMGKLGSHKDFFDAYDPHTDISGLTINLSKIPDDKVKIFREEMEKIYLEEKRKLIPPEILKIEKRRTLYKRLQDRWIPGAFRKIGLQPGKYVMGWLDKWFERKQIKMDLRRWNLYGKHIQIQQEMDALLSNGK